MSKTYTYDTKESSRSKKRLGNFSFFSNGLKASSQTMELFWFSTSDFGTIYSKTWPDKKSWLDFFTESTTLIMGSFHIEKVYLAIINTHFVSRLAINPFQNIWKNLLHHFTFRKVPFETRNSTTVTYVLIAINVCLIQNLSPIWWWAV